MERLVGNLGWKSMEMNDNDHASMNFLYHHNVLIILEKRFENS